jgi:hypothetical protein
VDGVTQTTGAVIATNLKAGMANLAIQGACCTYGEVHVSPRHFVHGMLTRQML